MKLTMKSWAPRWLTRTATSNRWQRRRTCCAIRARCSKSRGCYETSRAQPPRSPTHSRRSRTRARFPQLRIMLATRWRESAGAEPAVDRHRDSGNKARLIRRQERRQRTDLFRLSVAPEWMRIAGARPSQLCRAGGNDVAILGDRRLDHARANRDASNLVAREVERDSLRHDHDAALGRLIGAEIRHALD